MATLDAADWENNAQLSGHGYRLELERFDHGWLPLAELRRVQETIHTRCGQVDKQYHAFNDASMGLNKARNTAQKAYKDFHQGMADAESEHCDRFESAALLVIGLGSIAALAAGPETLAAGAVIGWALEMWRETKHTARDLEGALGVVGKIEKYLVPTFAALNQAQAQLVAAQKGVDASVNGANPPGRGQLPGNGYFSNIQGILTNANNFNKRWLREWQLALNRWWNEYQVQWNATNAMVKCQARQQAMQ